MSHMTKVEFKKTPGEVIIALLDKGYVLSKLRKVGNEYKFNFKPPKKSSSRKKRNEMAKANTQTHMSAS